MKALYLNQIGYSFPNELFYRWQVMDSTLSKHKNEKKIQKKNLIA